ncbi:MAG: hypothetical protein RL108_921 [Bacteroidota bacterium]|jgi:hypothetical protein
MEINTNMVKSSPQEIVFQTESDGQFLEYELHHSIHSLQRSKQRGISNEQIAIVTEYGSCIYGQGLTYYILGKKDVPINLKKQASKFENTIVIIGANGDQIVTCYRNRNPYQWIKHKPKELSRRQAA